MMITVGSGRQDRLIKDEPVLSMVGRSFCQGNNIVAECGHLVHVALLKNLA